GLAGGLPGCAAAAAGALVAGRGAAARRTDRTLSGGRLPLLAARGAERGTAATGRSGRRPAAYPDGGNRCAFRAGLAAGAAAGRRPALGRDAVDGLQRPSATYPDAAGQRRDGPGPDVRRPGTQLPRSAVRGPGAARRAGLGGRAAD